LKGEQGAQADRGHKSRSGLAYLYAIISDVNHQNILHAIPEDMYMNLLKK